MLTIEANIKEIKIKPLSKIYCLGEIIKKEKAFSVYYIEIYEGYFSGLGKKNEIQIQKNKFYIKINDIKQEKSFLFNMPFFRY